ncbi:MAG: exodeoxyribonuclease III, partial [Clostridia bacterium]|nr:exodeoxyribonuclease III [Clostridia bacterium]
LLHPDETGAYSWWSYMYNARKNNAGWRIDYFLCSERIKDRIRESFIQTEIMGSDHCPVGLILG